MATDRMYLHCPCGAEIAIARYLMPPWYAYERLAMNLDNWFEQHQFCQPGEYPAKPTLTFGSDAEHSRLDHPLLDTTDTH